MAKYAFNNVTVNFDNTGGSPVNMSAYITAINGVSIEAILQESTPVGVSYQEMVSTGIKRMQPVTLSGLYDDTATTGPDVIFNALGATRTLQIIYGSTKSTSVETIIQSYSRSPQQNGMTTFSVTLQPTGTITEA